MLFTGSKNIDSEDSPRTVLQGNLQVIPVELGFQLIPVQFKPT